MARIESFKLAHWIRPSPWEDQISVAQNSFREESGNSISRCRSAPLFIFQSYLILKILFVLFSDFVYWILKCFSALHGTAEDVCEDAIERFILSSATACTSVRAISVESFHELHRAMQFAWCKAIALPTILWMPFIENFNSKATCQPKSGEPMRVILLEYQYFDTLENNSSELRTPKCPKFSES